MGCKPLEPTSVKTLNSNYNLMKKTTFLLMLSLACMMGCSFLPDEPGEISIQTADLKDIVYGTWDIKAVADAKAYGDADWHEMPNPYPQFEFFVDGRYEYSTDGTIIEKKSFAIADEKLQLGVPEGIVWTVSEYQTNYLELVRETEDGMIKKRLHRH